MGLMRACRGYYLSDVGWPNVGVSLLIESCFHLVSKHTAATDCLAADAADVEAD